jgi:hypothetical protein
LATASPQRIDPDAAVEQAVDLITALPAPIRLEALSRLQAEVVQSVVDDGIRDGLGG